MGPIRLLVGISVFWLALSLLFDGINTLVLPNQLLAAVDEGAAATTLGLITFAGLLAGMLVQPIAGLWSDRWRGRIGRRGALALGTMLTLVALAIYGSARPVAGLFVGYLLVQVAASVAQASQQGFLPDLVPREARGTASGVKGFMDLAGAMLGFVLLGELLGEGQGSQALLLIGVVLAVTLGLTLLLVPERPAPLPAPSLPPLREAFRLELQGQLPFVALVLSRFLFLLGTYAVGRFLLLFVAERLGLSAERASEEAAGLLAVLALVTVLAALPAGWAADRWGRVPLMRVGAILSAAGVLLLIVADSRWEIGLFGSLLSLGSAAFASANWALTADLAPPDEAGRFFGLANFGTAGAAAAAGLFGPLVDATNRLAPGNGYNALFVAAALAFVASIGALRIGEG